MKQRFGRNTGHSEVRGYIRNDNRTGTDNCIFSHGDTLFEDSSDSDVRTISDSTFSADDAARGEVAKFANLAMMFHSGSCVDD
jgi:hypothetical protein